MDKQNVSKFDATIISGNTTCDGIGNILFYDGNVIRYDEVTWKFDKMENKSDNVQTNIFRISNVKTRHAACQKSQEATPKALATFFDQKNDFFLRLAIFRDDGNHGQTMATARDAKHDHKA